MQAHKIISLRFTPLPWSAQDNVLVLGNTDGRVVAFGAAGLRHQGKPADPGARRDFPWDEIRELRLIPGTAVTPFPWLNDYLLPTIGTVLGIDYYDTNNANRSVLRIVTADFDEHNLAIEPHYPAGISRTDGRRAARFVDRLMAEPEFRLLLAYPEQLLPALL
ncbi:hypothetical protein [Pseudarthrobacter sp. N5]|uniref:hypothetical protein n=1 Tax=Pseudarthrobacter sp. N5 TaxID=3418416 RepID=UPI003CF16124